MGAITFDTLAFSRTLRAAGFNDVQADAMAAAQQTAFEQMLANSDAASQNDIQAINAGIKGMHKEIAAINLRMAQMETRMAQMESRLVKTICMVAIGCSGVIGALLAVAVSIILAYK